MFVAIRVALLSTVIATEAFCDPFICGFAVNYTPKTLRATFDRADCVVIATAGKVIGHTANRPRRQVFEVVRSLKGDKYQPGEKVRISNRSPIKHGDRVMIHTAQGVPPESANQLVEISEPAIKYMLSAPKSDSPTSMWLSYYLPELASDDRVIREDAYRAYEYLKLTNLELADLIAARDSIPVNAITAELSSVHSIDSRTDFLGLLVGIAGEFEDTQRLKKILTDHANADNLIARDTVTGLVLLSGTEGLDWIDTHYLSNLDDKPLSQFRVDRVWAVRQAIQEIWKLAETDYDVPVSRQRFGQSLLRILICPELADFAIADLIKLRDWTHVERVYSLYEASDHNSQLLNRFAFQYLVYASQSDSHDWIDGPAAKAAEYLVMLEDKDAESFRSMMNRASRYSNEGDLAITLEPKREDAEK